MIHGYSGSLLAYILNWLPKSSSRFWTAKPNKSGGDLESFPHSLCSLLREQGCSLLATAAEDSDGRNRCSRAKLTTLLVIKTAQNAWRGKNLFPRELGRQTQICRNWNF